MRTYGAYPSFDLLGDPAAVRALLSSDHLVAARFEPTLSLRFEGILDLVFEHSGSFLAVALIKVEGAMLVVRESDPIIWPRWIAGLADEATLDALQERIYPWMRSLVLARFDNNEAFRFYRDEAAVRDDYMRARELGLLGAAPLLTVARSAAPAMYARRFTHGRRVGIFDPQGANGAALLAGYARSVEFDAGDAATTAFVRRWFSTLSIGQTADPGAIEVAVGVRERLPAAAVRVMRGSALPGEHGVITARPLPPTVLVSFDPEDSIEDARFAVAVPSSGTPRGSSVAATSVIGGSAGRVAIVAREDWQSNPDADTDAIDALVRRLRAEGFNAAVSGATKPLHPGDVDIVHVVGHRHAAVVLRNLETIKQHGTPISVMPYLDDPGAIAAWGGSTTLGALRSMPDDAYYQEYFGAIAARRLVWEVPLPVEPVVADPSVRALLALASSLIVVSSQEEAMARQRYGYAGAVVQVPAIFDTVDPEHVDALVGTQDFVLIHTSLEPRGGAIFAMLAAEQAGLTSVITGAIGSSEYYTYFQMLAGARSIYLAERLLTPGQLAGLYGRARVYLDASWSGYGLHRLTRAASSGAALTVSETSYARSVWGGDVETVDPASVDSIAAGLRRAWDAAPGRGSALANHARVAFDQQMALANVARAYQVAAAACVS
ncbi:MAG: hypothetical protein ACYDGM_05470 [Vulcanimicrobiaceae bacterium]